MTMVSSARTDEVLKVVVANPIMIKAFKSGVPTITLEGDANGAPHLDASVYAKKFSGRYSHRVATQSMSNSQREQEPATPRHDR
jgi:hypothetical protein